MAKESKKNKQIKKEDAAVQELFEQCESALTAAEFDSLTEGYECLKPFFVPGDYSEVAMTLLTTIYSRRKTAPDELVTLDKVINDTINSSLIAATVWGEIINSENKKLIVKKRNDRISIIFYVEILLKQQEIVIDLFPIKKDVDLNILLKKYIRNYLILN